jgi:hypothetical protein
MTRPQVPLAPPMEDKWIVLASGLNAGALDSFSLNLHILLKFVANKVGAECEISRMILAGNSMAPAKRLAFTNATKRFGSDYAPIDTAPLNDLDILLASVLNSTNIDLMSGERDPASISFPQQPINVSPRI